MEGLGVPTVVVTTTEFERLTRQVAATKQLSEARILVTQHPLGGTDEDVVEQWAKDSVNEVVRLFLT